MGKRIIVQARGKGSSTYRVKRKAYRFKVSHPKKLEGEGTVDKLFNSPAHSAPLAKISYKDGFFYAPASKGMIEGQKVEFGGSQVKAGNIMELGSLPLKTQVFAIEARPGDGGKFIKGSGGSAIINKTIGNDVFVLFPSKKERKFNKKCRAIVGVIAGHGRKDKPIVKAGKQFYIKKGKSKLWPRTSALKMNAIDHPFGSGRGKNPKSKIAKRNTPPGAKVGLIRPKRTGKRK